MQTSTNCGGPSQQLQISWGPDGFQTLIRQNFCRIIATDSSSEYQGLGSVMIFGQFEMLPGLQKRLEAVLEAYQADINARGARHGESQPVRGPDPAHS